MKLFQALPIAEYYLEIVLRYCPRAKIAGSLRRQERDVKDIEIVAESMKVSADQIPWELFAKGASPIKQGSRYQQYHLQEGINLDLFLVYHPAQWGVVYLIRTGPAKFSQWCVTPRWKGGALPIGYKVADGAVSGIETGLIKMPEESNFLEFLDILDLEDPTKRKPDWFRFDRVPCGE